MAVTKAELEQRLQHAEQLLREAQEDRVESEAHIRDLETRLAKSEQVVEAYEAGRVDPDVLQKYVNLRIAGGGRRRSKGLGLMGTKALDTLATIKWADANWVGDTGGSLHGLVCDQCHKVKRHNQLYDSLMCPTHAKCKQARKPAAPAPSKPVQRPRVSEEVLKLRKATFDDRRKRQLAQLAAARKPAPDIVPLKYGPKTETMEERVARWGEQILAEART